MHVSLLWFGLAVNVNTCTCFKYNKSCRKEIGHYMCVCVCMKCTWWRDLKSLFRDGSEARCQTAEAELDLQIAEFFEEGLLLQVELWTRENTEVL